MEQCKNYSSSVKEAGYEQLQADLGWILSNLKCKDKSDLVRVGQPNWIPSFIPIAFKKLYFKDYTGVVNGNVNSVARAIGNKIERVETKHGLDGNLVEFKQAERMGECYASSFDYLLSIKLLDLGFPFIVFSIPVAIGSQSLDLGEIIVSREHLVEFTTYIQNEERLSGRITVKVYGQKTYTVKPIEWDNLVLDESIDFLIRKDLDNFMRKREWFSSKGIPYRRGYLLHGAPGNGKTSAIRAMLTQAKLPAFTIKKMYDPDAMYDFEDMFEAAGQTGGAFIILEDIDRSFAAPSDTKAASSGTVPFSVFLNCLDGVSDSDGVIVIATANSPQVLDRAILERPGRFDRVVHFANPTPTLINRYFSGHLPMIPPYELAKVSNLCNNMSFAQLREIYIMASQIAEDGKRDVKEEDLMEAHKRLLSYMKKAGAKESGFKN